MTVDEVIVRLRDIHLPPDANEGLGLDFAIWPLAVFGTICFTVFALVVWRRNQWRRETRAELRRIQANSNSLYLWPALLSLALESSRLSGHRYPLPESAFQAPDTVTDEDVAALVAHVKKAIRL